jgi:hypothetical protein
VLAKHNGQSTPPHHKTTLKRVNTTLELEKLVCGGGGEDVSGQNTFDDLSNDGERP